MSDSIVLKTRQEASHIYRNEDMFSTNHQQHHLTLSHYDIWHQAILIQSIWLPSAKHSIKISKDLSKFN